MLLYLFVLGSITLLFSVSGAQSASSGCPDFSVGFAVQKRGNITHESRRSGREVESRHSRDFYVRAPGDPHLPSTLVIVANDCTHIDETTDIQDAEATCAEAHNFTGGTEIHCHNDQGVGGAGNLADVTLGPAGNNQVFSCNPPLPDISFGQTPPQCPDDVLVTVCCDPVLPELRLPPRQTEVKTGSV